MLAQRRVDHNYQPGPPSWTTTGSHTLDFSGAPGRLLTRRFIRSSATPGPIPTCWDLTVIRYPMGVQQTGTRRRARVGPTQERRRTDDYAAEQGGCDLIGVWLGASGSW